MQAKLQHLLQLHLADATVAGERED